MTGVGVHYSSRVRLFSRLHNTVLPILSLSLSFTLCLCMCVYNVNSRLDSELLRIQIALQDDTTGIGFQVRYLVI